LRQSNKVYDKDTPLPDNEWGDQLTGSHVIPPELPDETLKQQSTNNPEAQLIRMLKAAGLNSFETERPITLSGGIVTRPDVYFDGLCAALDCQRFPLMPKVRLRGPPMTRKWKGG
jgi:hypothetical protein